jgi:predicted DNA-binding ribbon-helix-helix protein
MGLNNLSFIIPLRFALKSIIRYDKKVKSVNKNIMSRVFSVRLEDEEIKELHKIAESLNYFYGGKPAFSKVLKDIAQNKLIISRKLVDKTEDS